MIVEAWRIHQMMQWDQVTVQRPSSQRQTVFSNYIEKLLICIHRRWSLGAALAHSHNRQWIHPKNSMNNSNFELNVELECKWNKFPRIFTVSNFNRACVLDVWKMGVIPWAIESTTIYNTPPITCLNRISPKKWTISKNAIAAVPLRSTLTMLAIMIYETRLQIRTNELINLMKRFRVFIAILNLRHATRGDQNRPSTRWICLQILILLYQCTHLKFGYWTVFVSFVCFTRA